MERANDEVVLCKAFIYFLLSVNPSPLLPHSIPPVRYSIEYDPESGCDHSAVQM